MSCFKNVRWAAGLDTRLLEAGAHLQRRDHHSSHPALRMLLSGKGTGELEFEGHPSKDASEP